MWLEKTSAKNLDLKIYMKQESISTIEKKKNKNDVIIFFEVQKKYRMLKPKSSKDKKWKNNVFMEM